MKLSEIKLLQACGCVSWPRPLPWKGSHRHIWRRASCGWKSTELGQFGEPEQREIVSVRGEELNKRVEIQSLWRSVATKILKGVPGLRPVQDKNIPFGVLEVIGIVRD